MFSIRAVAMVAAFASVSCHCFALSEPKNNHVDAGNISSASTNTLSLDDIDRLSWGDGIISPLEQVGVIMTECNCRARQQSAHHSSTLDLSGTWEMAEDNNGVPQWNEAVTANIPGSIHTALFEAGLIPDPLTGINDSIALQQSYKGWWLRRNFNHTPAPDSSRMILDFEGIANYCAVFLNGVEIGTHEGMFGGPTIDVTDMLRKGENSLVVKLEPVPNIATGMTGLDRDSWRNTVVINCVYGWHYAKIMPLGIWQPVKLRQQSAVRMENPFIITRSTDGDMRLCVTLHGTTPADSLILSITPPGADGPTQHFSAPVTSESGKVAFFDFTVKKPRLWWPNDMGEHPLYEATLTLQSPQGSDTHRMKFGIRTIEMRPLPSGKSPDRYDWTMKINGHEMFVKGTNWCSVDALLRFDSLRYTRMLTSAASQHLQLLRAWGGGAPETDRFYELCDSLGLMVFQEWPTAWNSHNDQPYKVLEETVVRNTLRLRNHPSLVMWGGGNESTEPFGKAIDMMGRVSVELDGTRPFHRGEPWGGSRHDYGCWWGNLHLNHNLNMTADYWGEYGIPSMPDRETVDRYLDGEPYIFPVRHDSRFNHHMPVFGNVDEIKKAEQLCRYFSAPDSLDDFIIGTQLAQVVGGCSVIERARTRRPQCAGVWYYKLNDVYPALSWSSIDYYGCLKPYHYFLARSMAPQNTVILFNRTNLCSQSVKLPWFLLDDFGNLADSNVTATATVYNYNMHPVHTVSHTLIPDSTVVRLPDIELDGQMTDSELLLFKTDLTDSAGKLIARNWYFTNYETRQGILFDFPGHVRCGDKLKVQQTSTGVTVTNHTNHPAVGVTLRAPGHQHEITFSDNYLWLDAGESRHINTNMAVPEITVTAWNLSSWSN